MDKIEQKKKKQKNFLHLFKEILVFALNELISLEEKISYTCLKKLICSNEKISYDFP